LERLLNESWRMPLSAYLVINEDDFLDVIDQLRTAIPKEIKQAERIQQERDRMIAQAEEEAERIVQMAHDESSKQLEDHQIITAAKQRAQTIIERAQRDAEVLRLEADEYAKQVLVSLDGQLGAMENQIAVLLSTVRNGLQTLSGNQAAELESEPEPDAAA
jgi:cell division septum initiation protein DivIVA